MLFRAIALSVALLVGVGTIVPLMTDYSEAGPKHSRKYKKKKYKKYSKAWWRQYRAQQRRKRAAVARHRAYRARQILNARLRAIKNTNEPANFPVVAQTSQKNDAAPVILPSGEAAPQTWKRAQASSSELQYRVNDLNGNPMGAASLTVVGTAAGADSNGSNKTLGGVSTSALRRTVIDKMMKEDGFVVNDYQKDINGKKVFVVVAQSAVKGIIQSRLFYFTEVDGRIYSLATAAARESQELLARESEKVINSLQRNNRSTQAGLR